MWLQKVVMEFWNCFNVCEGKIKANRPLAVISFFVVVVVVLTTQNMYSKSTAVVPPISFFFLCTDSPCFVQSMSSITFQERTRRVRL